MTHEALDKVIKEGIRLLELQNLNEEMVQVWINYSYNILDIISYNSFIKYQYHIFISELRSRNLPPYELLRKCVEYLIDSIPNL